LECRVFPATRKITIKLLKDASLRPLGVNITDIVMPSSVKTAIVQVELYSKAGVKYDSSASTGSSAFTLTPTAATLQRSSAGSETLTNSNKTVGGVGQLTVSIRTANKVAGGANIRMRFPKWYGGLSYVNYAFNKDKTKGCTLVKSGASVIESGATCGLDTSDGSFDVLMIKKAFTTDVDAGKDITFIIAGVRNYPSTRGVKGIQIQTQMAAGYAIDQSLDNGFAPKLPARSPASNFALRMDNGLAEATVSERVRLKLNLYLLNPCSKKTEIKIVFPLSVDLSRLTSVSLMGTSSGGQLKTRKETSAGGRRVDTIVIEDAFKQDQAPGQLTILSFDKILAPQSDEETAPFKFELSEVDGS